MTTLAASETVRIPAGMVLIPGEEYDELLKAKANDEYRKKLNESFRQFEEGRVIAKTMDELEALIDE